MARETPTNLPAKPREGPPLALQLSSNRREREVGQVPAGVGRILALAPGESWFLSQLQPEREAAQRQNRRWDLRKEGGGIRSTTSRPKDRIQPASAISQASLVLCIGHPLQSFPNNTKPWTQGQGPHTPPRRELSHQLARKALWTTVLCRDPGPSSRIGSWRPINFNQISFFS